MGLEDDLTLSALVPQNALPSDLLENVLCGVAFGLGVLGIIMGIVFFICSQRRCSDGKSLGKVRDKSASMGVCQDSPSGLGACIQHSGLHSAIWGPCYTHTVIGENRNSLEQGVRSPGDLWETCLVMTWEGEPALLWEH